MRNFLAVVLVLFSAAAFGNPIQDENRKPGTVQWQLQKAAKNHEIEGYASKTSVNLGEPIRLFVSTKDPSYTIEIFRLGWYNGSGGRRMTNAVAHKGHLQVIPQPEKVTGLIECHWIDPVELIVPKNWVSGVYLAKLTGRPSGNQNYILFVVRDDDRKSDFLFQSCVTTLEAYNNWGGKSLYPFNSTGPQAAVVSFDRPYSDETGPDHVLYRYEYDAVRFLEREGYDVTYSTSVDTHARGQNILRHRAFLSFGHDEYWSWQMRQNVENGRDHGVNLGFFSGNVCYWQIRFASDWQGEPDRRIIAWKEDVKSDPVLHDSDPHNDYLATTLWRNPPVNRPEENLVGAMTSIVGVDGDVVVEHTDHWVFRNSGLKDGDHLKGLAGHEVSKMFKDYPPDTVRLSHSEEVSTDGQKDFQEMTIYRAPSGAWVFSAGTIQWAWGLDGFNDAAHPGRVSAAAQRITRNVLNAFLKTAR